MQSRYEIALEQYILAITVEANLSLEIANTMILPAAIRYQTELATNVASLKIAGVEIDTATLNEVSSGIADLRAGIAVLRSELAHDDVESAEKHASTRRRGCCRPWRAVRAASDLLETMIADDLWPLATYQEMLFIL